MSNITREPTLHRDDFPSSDPCQPAARRRTDCSDTFPFAGFVGRIAYHCHILNHEDLGFERRQRKLVLAAVALALLASACGGGSPERGAVVTTPTEVISTRAEGSELAGVRFDIRRDPG